VTALRPAVDAMLMDRQRRNFVAIVVNGPPLMRWWPAAHLRRPGIVTHIQSCGPCAEDLEGPLRA
jgi:hypothetical protein